MKRISFIDGRMDVYARKRLGLSKMQWVLISHLQVATKFLNINLQKCVVSSSYSVIEPSTEGRHKVDFIS